MKKTLFVDVNRIFHETTELMRALNIITIDNLSTMYIIVEDAACQLEAEFEYDLLHYKDLINFKFSEDIAAEMFNNIAKKRIITFEDYDVDCDEESLIHNNIHMQYYYLELIMNIIYKNIEVRNL